MGMKIYINGVTYDLNGGYGIGYTAQGEKFLFDKEDFDKIVGYRWCLDKNGYVVAFTRELQRRKIIRLHQLIMGKPPKGKQIDHIQSLAECPKKADNRKENLRFVTPKQNSYNRGLRSDNTSGHTGVGELKSDRRYLARVTKNGKSKSKRFPLDKYDEACLWQEKTAKKMFGRYAPTLPPK